MSCCLVVTQSVQLVGIYLVFAMLIVPALAAGVSAKPCIAGRLPGRHRRYVAGLIVSSRFDLPTGAMIVVALVACLALASLLAPPKIEAKS